MDLSRPEREKQNLRALIGTDANGAAVVLSTDSVDIKSFAKEVFSGAEDIGLVDSRDLTPGLYLWEGVAELEHESCFKEPELNFYGDIRPVEPHEIADLYHMTPPETEGQPY